MKQESEKHIFALMWSNHEYPLSTFTLHQSYTITDPDLIHRIVTVLRLAHNDSCILFDRFTQVHITLTALAKKNITITIQEIHTTEDLKPHITCALPLLKREALETALDALTQLGASTIQLITTQKIHRSAFGTKDLDRLQRILNAAAEQSKNFAFPCLKAPQTLHDFIQSQTQKNTASLFFDPQGISAFDVITTIKKNPPSHLVLIIGPEGDLTEQEKSYLRDHKVIFTALTPTILRAEQAAALGLGIVRSSL